MEPNKVATQQNQSLTLTFDFDIDDMMAFQDNYLINTKQFRNLKIFLTLLLPVVSVLFVLRMEMREGVSAGLIGAGVFLLIASIIWVVVIRKIIKKNILSKIRKNILKNDKENSIVFGKREMRFDENGIFLKADKTESLTKWVAVLKVVKDAKHYYLYIASNQSFVVPLDKIGDSKAELDSIISKHVANIVVVK